MREPACERYECRSYSFQQASLLGSPEAMRTTSAHISLDEVRNHKETEHCLRERQRFEKLRAGKHTMSRISVRQGRSCKQAGMVRLALHSLLFSSLKLAVRQVRNTHANRPFSCMLNFQEGVMKHHTGQCGPNCSPITKTHSQAPHNIFELAGSVLTCMQQSSMKLPRPT